MAKKDNKPAGIYAVAFCNENRVLFTGDTTGTIKAWDCSYLIEKHGTTVAKSRQQESYSHQQTQVDGKNQSFSYSHTAQKQRQKT